MRRSGGSIQVVSCLQICVARASVSDPSSSELYSIFCGSLIIDSICTIPGFSTKKLGSELSVHLTSIGASIYNSHMLVKKTIFTLLSIFVFLLLLSNVKAENVKQNADSDIPEVSGTYDVPGHTNMKVKVFVHNPHQNQLPTSACSDPDSSGC